MPDENWFDDLPEDLRGNGEVTGSDSLEAFTRRAVGHRQALSKAITVPGDGATDEELTKFGTRMSELGFAPADHAPGDGERYVNGDAKDYMPIEGEAGEKWLEAQEHMLKESGVGKQTAGKILKNMSAGMKKSFEAFKEIDTTTGAQLTEKYGPNMEAAMSAAARGAKAMGLDNLMDTPLMGPDGTMYSLSHNQGLIDMLANFGKTLGEDQTNTGKGGQGEGGPSQDLDELISERRSLMSADSKIALGDPEKQNAREKLAEVNWKITHAKRGVAAPPYPGLNAQAQSILHQRRG